VTKLNNQAMPTAQTTTSEQQQDQRRPGPPLGSANAIRHGMRGSAMPKGCHHIDRATCHFRRQLEGAVLEARGEITLVDAAFVNTAYRAERHAQLAQRWLYREATSMTPADRLNYSREVVKASESRDKAIAALNLTKRPSDLWATLESHQINHDSDTRDSNGTSVQVANSSDNASGGVLGDDKANA
jgi:hypothetical protein